MFNLCRFIYLHYKRQAVNNIKEVQNCVYLELEITFDEQLPNEIQNLSIFTPD